MSVDQLRVDRQLQDAPLSDRLNAVRADEDGPRSVSTVGRLGCARPYPGPEPQASPFVQTTRVAKLPALDPYTSTSKSSFELGRRRLNVQ